MSALDQLALLAEACQAVTLAREARRWAERTRDNRFYVACLGQFKRGKSTLINALVGERLLPSGVAPVTSVVTLVRAGASEARVLLADGSWQDVTRAQIADYVTERKNPENRLGVLALEIGSPSPLLAEGLCLVDTPGLGSVLEGNTRETRAFLPQVDACLMVLGGDPPLSGEELELLRQGAAQASELVLVLNKVDRLSDSDCEEALEFTRNTLARTLGQSPTLYRVSALERLEGRGPERDWPRLLERLQGLTGSSLIQSAVGRGMQAFSERLRRHLEEEKAALVQPMELTRQRVETLRRACEEADHALAQLAPRFAGEQERLRQAFRSDQIAFLERAVPLCQQRLETGCDPVELAEAAVRDWRQAMLGVAETRFVAMTGRFVAEINAILSQVDASRPLEPETGIRARSTFHFLDLWREAEARPLDRLRDAFRSRAGRRESALGRSRKLLRRLLEVNSNRVVGDFDGRIRESRRSVEGALRDRLKELAASAEAAAARAESYRQQGETAMAGRLAQLQLWEDQLQALTSG